VQPLWDPPEAGQPFQFEIAIAVRHQDRALRDSLDKILVRRRKEIDAVLSEYGVPRRPVGRTP
jgi:mxaJ protein